MLFSNFILLHTIAYASAQMLPQYAQLQYIRTFRDPLPVLVQASSNFSFNLLTSLGRSKLTNQSVSNAVISPLGIVNTLAIMRLASSGKTREEFNQLPIFQLPNGDVGFAFNQLNKQSQIQSEKNDEQQIDISNFMFVENTMKIKPNFANRAFHTFQMEILLASFSDYPQEIRALINELISNRTQGLIPNMLSPSDVDAQTQVVLANTISFRALWKNPFPRSRSILFEPFYLKDGTATTVPMMNQVNRLRNHILCKRIGNSTSCRDQKIPDIVEIPFRGGNQTMILLVPNKMVSNEEIEENFLANLKKWRAATKLSYVSLTMPKFKLEYEVDLKSALKELGLQNVFDSTSSSFDHLTDQPLTFAKFVHKTSVNVTENGVTLAAASAAMATLRIARPKSNSIVVDKPFLFFVEDTRTKMILFLGRVNDPR